MNMELDINRDIGILVNLINDKTSENIINYEIDKILYKYGNNIDVVNILEYYISKCRMRSIANIKYMDNKDKKIVLITQFFEASSERRQHELNCCLTHNILNDSVDEILLLTEYFIDIRKYLICKLEFKQLSKVRQIVIGDRLTLYKSIEYCKKDENIYIISNSDILLSDSIKKLKVMDNDGIVYALSRYELQNEYVLNGRNDALIFTHDGRMGNPVIDSHDAWVITNKIRNDDRLNVPLGTCGIDNIANYIFMENGYRVINPVMDIHLVHYHMDNYRNDTVNGMRNNSNSVVDKDYRDLKCNIRYIQQQSVSINHEIKCIVTLCTDMSYENDLKYLLNSIREYEPDMEIYILCDSYVYNNVKKDYVDLKINVRNGLDKYSGMSRSDMDKKDKDMFKELCFEKINCVEFGLEENDNCLYLDSDIILLNKLELNIPIEYECGLCPHNIIKENTDLYGYYNAGMMFIGNKDVCKTWRDNKVKSRFLDQACLEDIADIHKCYKFGDEYNYGWWRLFQCNNPQERLDKFMTSEINGGELLYNYIPIRTIHTHLHEKNDVQTLQFNNIILKLLNNSVKYNWLRNVLSNKENILSDKEDVLSDKENVLSDKNNVLSDKDNVLSNKKDVLNDKEDVLSDKENVLSDKEDILSNKEDVLSDNNNVLSDKEDVLSDKENKEGEICENSKYNINVTRNLKNRIIVKVPKQPQNGKYHHNNDTFREIIRLWRDKGYISVDEDVKYKHIYMDDDILLYDRPTLEWMDEDIEYKLGLFGNPELPNNGKENTNWIFWGRHPERLTKFISENPYNKYEDRYITTIFIGNIENNIQSKYRNSDDWRKYINFYDLTKNMNGEYKYSHEEYLKLLYNSKYGLCLRGYGGKCNREIEYMGLGVVPLITEGVSLTYYNKMEEGVHYIKVSNPEDILNVYNIDEDKWNIMSKKCIEWYNNNCSVEGSFKTTMEIVNRYRYRGEDILECNVTNVEGKKDDEIKVDSDGNEILVSDGIQKSYERRPLKSLDNITNMLEIHNKNHTAVDWDNICNFDRVQEQYIKKIKSRYILEDGKYMDSVEGANLNIVSFEKNGDMLLNLVGKWGYGYFHFVCEILPRILYFIKNRELLKYKKIYLLLYFNNTFILNYIQLLSNELDGVEVIPYNKNYIYDTNNIDTYLVTPTICGNPSLEGISLIRHYYLNKLVAFDECCILIKRKEVDRSIENFDEVYEYLNKNYNKDRWIIFDELNVRDTMYLFNNAKVVVGSHGAGLSNIVFGMENMYILEFVPELNFNCCYWNLSNIMKQHHIVYPVKNYVGDGSFRVDIERLKKYMDNIYENIDY